MYNTMAVAGLHGSTTWSEPQLEVAPELAHGSHSVPVGLLATVTQLHTLTAHAGVRPPLHRVLAASS